MAVQDIYSKIADRLISLDKELAAKLFPKPKQPSSSGGTPFLDAVMQRKAAEKPIERGPAVTPSPYGNRPTTGLAPTTFFAGQAGQRPGVVPPRPPGLPRNVQLAPPGAVPPPSQEFSLFRDRPGVPVEGVFGTPMEAYRQALVEPLAAAAWARGRGEPLRQPFDRGTIERYRETVGPLMRLGTEIATDPANLIGAGPALRLAGRAGKGFLKAGAETMIRETGGGVPQRVTAAMAAEAGGVGKRTVVIQTPRIGDKGFKSWSKVVDNVDQTKTTGYAFEGRFIPEGKQTIPVGSHILAYGEEGSRARHYPLVELYEVTSDGLKKVYEKQNLGLNWSLSIRDDIANIVKQALSKDKPIPPEIAAARAVPAPAAEATRTLWHGRRSNAQESKSVLSWFTPSRKYAQEYGQAEQVKVNLGKILDLRKEVIKPGETFEAERTVDEWVKILRAKGVDAKITDPKWADVDVKFWDLLHDADLNATKATNLSEALITSPYNSIATWERTPQNERVLAYGIVRRPQPLVAAEAAPAAQAAKQPWMMTDLREVKRLADKGLIEPWQTTKAQNIEFMKRQGLGPEAVKRAVEKHKSSITQALAEGKPVPASVLAEYPDLAAKAPVAAAPEAAREMLSNPDVAREYLGIARNNKGYRDLVDAAKIEAQNPRLRNRPATQRLKEIDTQDVEKAQTRFDQIVKTPAATESAVARGGLEPTAPTGQARALPQEVTPPVAAASGPGVAPPVVSPAVTKAVTPPEAVAPQVAKQSHIDMGAPDGPRPPRPPKGRGKQPPQEPDDIVAQIVAKATIGERPDQTLLRLHEAAISNGQRRVNITIRDGTQKLKALGIGVMRRGQLVPRDTDIPKLDALYNALHNPSKVASGEIAIPKGYEAAYNELRGLTDWEQTARLDFDPNMATVEDYFYRGWKPPQEAFAGVQQGRPLVRTPAFKKPRVDATYQEMREAGFEPLFWNPYQQWGISRMQGTKYREQMQLVDYLKGMGDELIRPHEGGPVPHGWRVPEVGPAFEGKPFAITDKTTDEARTLFTRRWIVPDRVANGLENIYGKRPNIGKVVIGGKTIDPLAVIDWLTFVPKRAKLVASFFQQVDFLTRAGAGSWSRLVDGVEAGKPITGLKAWAKYPETAVNILRANFSPAARQSLARQLDDTTSLITGRPGINLKGISEAGLSTTDVTIFPADIDKLVRQVATETGMLAKVKRGAAIVADVESAMRRGLFEGVYRAAIITDIRNNIAPMMARKFPTLNDAQLNGVIARIANVKYSTIPASQSVIQNQVIRETLRRVFFSVNESEGLLRQAAGAISGPYKDFWRKHFIGAYLFLIATASVIHFASTGKPLPKERFIPVSKDRWGPLPFGYNTRFASPTLPFKGRGGAELTLDVVGQMDTALRVLNPAFFVESRESVPIRAILNQVSGTDFFGKPIDDVGPGGVVSRTGQLATDMFAPIGVGGLMVEGARQAIPGAEDVFNEGETRLGLTGLGLQATGVNIRAATREQRLVTVHGEGVRGTLNTLDSLGVWPASVARKFDMKIGVKGGEVELTTAQREQLQWLTDDAVVKAVQTVISGPSFQNLNNEQKKEAIQAAVTPARDRVRKDFRSSNLTLRAPQTPAPTTPQAPTVEDWQKPGYTPYYLQGQAPVAPTAPVPVAPGTKPKPTWDKVTGLMDNAPPDTLRGPIPEVRQQIGVIHLPELLAITREGGLPAWKAFDKVWYQGGTLTPEEERVLMSLFQKYPLGQSNFKTWYKQTVRQLWQRTSEEWMKEYTKSPSAVGIK